MPQFKWYGLLPNGKPLSARVFARSVEHARQIACPGANTIRVVPVRSFFSRMTSNRTTFVGHLADLLEGGALISEVLAILAHSSVDPLAKAWAADLVIQIQAGVSLADAAAQWPELADPQLIAAIELGERTGALSQSIKGYVWLSEMHNELIGSARRSMALPFFAGIFALLVAGLFVITIRPQYHALIESIQGTKSAQVPLFVGSFSYYWISAFGLLCALLVLFFIFKRKTIRQYIPAFSAYDEALFLVRFSTLISQCYGLSESLIRASSASASDQIRDWGARAGKAIDSGESFSMLCAEAPLLFETRSLLLLGERSGSLKHWASKAAFRARDVAFCAAKRLSSLVVGLLLLSVGLVIAGVIYTLYQPIIALMQVV